MIQDWLSEKKNYEQLRKCCSLLLTKETSEKYEVLITLRCLKWQCRLIFESESWKEVEVNNHHSGVTYGCFDQHGTWYQDSWSFFFKVYPFICPIPWRTSGVGLTVGEGLFSSFLNENGWNSEDGFGRWKCLGNWAFCAFGPFYKFQQFLRYALFYVILKTFLNAKTRGVAGWIWHFRAPHFDGNVKNFVLMDFGVGNTIKKWRGLARTFRIFVFLFF